LNNRDQSSVRILEIIEIQYSEDGECYAQKLKVLFGLVDAGDLQLAHSVSEKVVESVLNHIRQSEFADTRLRIHFTLSAFKPQRWLLSGLAA
jgi:hypothetical protein